MRIILRKAVAESRSQVPESAPIAASRRWVEQFVVAHELCPFAKREVDAGRVRYSLSNARDEAALLTDLEAELQHLQAEPGTETTLLVHPQVLADFMAYNQFLDLAEGLVAQLGLVGEIQIASFHPDYQFAGTEAQAAENYSNRSPFPMLHLIREASLERALASYPGIEEVPARNIALMNTLGAAALARALRQYRQEDA
jgi:hypothetical protein